MSHNWLVALGIDVRFPQGLRERSLLGHRILLSLRHGPKSVRELHAILGRKVAADDRRAALAELQSTGLVKSLGTAGSPRGGRPRETWTLLYPSSSSVLAAEQAIRAESEARRRRCQQKPLVQPLRHDLRGASPIPLEGGPRRARSIKPVPPDVADEICDWIASGRYLREFCRLRGELATRTVYAWLAKDPRFRSRFQAARDFGEQVIRDQYLELAASPLAAAALAGDRRSRREFHRNYARPIQLRLQRWRKHT